MRTLPVVAASLALVASLAGGTPAHAGGGAFSGWVSVDCFGCGDSPGSGAFVLEGVGPFSADFTEFAPATYPGCVLSGHAEGSFSGAVNGPFSWDRRAWHLDIRTNGLPGEGVFVITSPLGNPCGQPVVAFVAGTLVL